MHRRKFIVSAAALLTSTAARGASFPNWYKRLGSIVPSNTTNEFCWQIWNGKLLMLAFNRPPLTTAIKVYDASDRTNPILLATIPWTGCMGASIIDPVNPNLIHVYGSTTTFNDANSIVHAVLDTSTWTLGATSTIFGPSGVNFYNLAITAYPGGYVLVNEHEFANGSQDASYYSCPDPNFGSNKVYLSNPPANFWGSRFLRWMPDGWCYILSDTLSNRDTIGRTQDFVHFKISTGPYDPIGSSFPGDTFLNCGWDGNTVLEDWTVNGQPIVVAGYFNSNEGQGSFPSYGAASDAFTWGTMAQLFARFTFPP